MIADDEHGTPHGYIIGEPASHYATGPSSGKVGQLERRHQRAREGSTVFVLDATTAVGAAGQHVPGATNLHRERIRLLVPAEPDVGVDRLVAAADPTESPERRTDPRR